MYETYLVQPQDIEAIFNAVTFTEDPELAFIFKGRERLQNVAIVTFDSADILLFTSRKLELPVVQEKSEWQLYKLPHQEPITDKDQQGWKAGIRKDEFLKYLPAGVSEMNIISGGLLTPLTKIQAAFPWPSAYTTYESYITTIVHEFGHIYFNSFPHLWYSNNKQTLPLLESARDLFAGRQDADTSMSIMIPTYPFMAEVFAFCTEYSLVSHKFPEYQKFLDETNLHNTEKYISQERERNIALQETVLYADYHVYAGVIGRILIAKFGNQWPEVLLKERYLDLQS